MSKETVKFKLEITMPKRWAKKFIQMLDCMKWCGDVGASRTVAFYADGDGDFRPFKFEVNGKKLESGIKWHEFDKGLTKEQKENWETVLPKFKTRKNVDFFFDAG